MIAHELACLEFDVAGQGRDAQAEDGNVPFAEAERLPLQSVDVFRDLGMSEETIAGYLWRWQLAGSATISH